MRAPCQVSPQWIVRPPRPPRPPLLLSLAAKRKICVGDGAVRGQKAKGYQHEGFPSGPPPQYSPRLNPLNFGVRMGSGAFGLVWPIANLYCNSLYKYPSPLGVPAPHVFLHFRTNIYNHKSYIGWGTYI